MGNSTYQFALSLDKSKPGRCMAPTPSAEQFIKCAFNQI